MTKPIPHARLEDYTTFRLGGPCRFLVKCCTPDSLITCLKNLHQQKIPFILIGGGSNLVVSDEGLDVAVVRYATQTPLIEREGCDIVVSGSTELDALALYCVNEGLAGLNFATGIPGTVGGAVIGNAGAWGKQVGDVLTEVTLLNPDGSIKKVPREDCGFEYRHSRFKEKEAIILSVRFHMQESDPIALAQERMDILQKRSEKHPNLKTHPCAGSFFRNVEPTSKAGHRQAAGWFLEQAGGKSLRVGGAKIFEKHANIIVKGTGCTSQHIYEISQEMKRIVQEKYGFELIREVRFVGKFQSETCNEQGFW